MACLLLLPLMHAQNDFVNSPTAHSGRAAPAADARGHFVALGTIASHAPPAALLAALRALRPAWEVRLDEIAQRDARGRHYRVAARVDDSAEPAVGPAIDVWLRIKSALIAAFPADKPNAVTALDP